MGHGRYTDINPALSDTMSVQKRDEELKRLTTTLVGIHAIGFVKHGVQD